MDMNSAILFTPFSLGGQTLRNRIGSWMVNNGYTREMAIEAISSGYADLIAFGGPYIANPYLSLPPSPPSGGVEKKVAVDEKSFRIEKDPGGEEIRRRQNEKIEAAANLWFKEFL